MLEAHARIYARAAELLKIGWCRGAMAVDPSGNHVESTSRRASSWCVMGAIYRAGSEMKKESSSDDPVLISGQAITEAAKAFGCSLQEINDHRWQSQQQAVEAMERLAMKEKVFMPNRLNDNDTMPWGKYTGEPLGNVPDEYWVWFLKQDWCDKYPELTEYANCVETEE